MKKLSAVFSFLLALLALPSCAVKLDGGDGHQQPEADYTVIFWSMLGTQDESVFADLGDLVNMRRDGRIGKNINFVGIVKTSPWSNYIKNGYQDSLARYGYEGTLYIDLPETPTVELPNMTYSGDNFPVNSPAMIAKVCSAINARKYADKNYPLYDPENLSRFIREAAESHPAKHYVLMLLGHGTGYYPTEETANEAGYVTRSCVFDYFSEKGITADNLVAAINTSGVKIQTIFFHNCLMSTLENLAAYRYAADFAICSAEVTESRYLQNYVAYISQAGDDLNRLKEASRKTIDFYAERCSESRYYTSQGFYELSQTGALIDAVREAVNWLIDAIDKEPDFISAVVMNTVNCHNLYDITNNDTRYVNARNLVYNLLLKDNLSDTEIDQLSSAIVDIAFVSVSQGAIFSHLMYYALQLKNLVPKLDFTDLQTAYDKYMATLRSMAYIKGSYDASGVNADYFYLLASPTVNLFSMNKDYYRPTGVIKYAMEKTLDEKVVEFSNALRSKDTDKVNELSYDLFNGVTFALVSPLETVLSNYKASHFDKETNWSSFLQKLEVSPSYIITPGRDKYYKSMMK